MGNGKLQGVMREPVIFWSDVNGHHSEDMPTRSELGKFHKS